MLLITGAAGFIGGNFIHHWFARLQEAVIVLDKLTYAGNAKTIASFLKPGICELVHGDIIDRELVAGLLKKHRPRAVLHFAAESHVDRSIHGPAEFIQTNIVGSFTLLDAVREHWSCLPGAERDAFRFLHVSTDEVYGSLDPHDPAFTETTSYAPNSPYSASKAGSDHLVRAYHHTYGLPTLTTNCSNNYGPYHFPEKLIPLMLVNALDGKPLPVYGRGENVRDWLYVEDHCRAIQLILEQGKVGETYNVGGRNEWRNLDIVRHLSALLDRRFSQDESLRSRFPKCPASRGERVESLITFVTDRLGHDWRYAIDASKVERELGFKPKESFETGIEKTVDWYLSHESWWRDVLSGAYRRR